MADKELNTGYIRSRYRDLEPLSSDEPNKAYAVYTSSAPVTPLGHKEYSVSGSQSLTGLPTGIKRAHLYNLGPDDAYWTDDGTTPSSSHGFPLKKDVWLLYDVEMDSNFKIVSVGSSDIRVAFYG